LKRNRTTNHINYCPTAELAVAFEVVPKASREIPAKIPSEFVWILSKRVRDPKSTQKSFSTVIAEAAESITSRSITELVTEECTTVVEPETHAAPVKPFLDLASVPASVPGFDEALVLWHQRLLDLSKLESLQRWLKASEKGFGTGVRMHSLKRIEVFLLP
jgi:hypothetical protein